MRGRKLGPVAVMPDFRVVPSPGHGVSRTPPPVYVAGKCANCGRERHILASRMSAYVRCRNPKCGMWMRTGGQP